MLIECSYTLGFQSRDVPRLRVTRLKFIRQLFFDFLFFICILRSFTFIRNLSYFSYTSDVVKSQRRKKIRYFKFVSEIYKSKY